MELRNVWAVRWVRQNICERLVEVWQRGANPTSLALSGGVGLYVGVFPVYGFTTLLCGCFIAILRSNCNAPTMLIANLVTKPFELVMVVPFLRLGEFAVGGKKFPFSKDALWKILTGKASWDVVLGLYHAVLGWVLAAPIAISLLYLILLPLMRFAIRRYGNGPDPVVGLLTPLLKEPAECVVEGKGDGVERNDDGIQGKDDGFV